jgi:hypothetical protein
VAQLEAASRSPSRPEGAAPSRAALPEAPTLLQLPPLAGGDAAASAPGPHAAPPSSDAVEPPDERAGSPLPPHALAAAHSSPERRAVAAQPLASAPADAATDDGEEFASPASSERPPGPPGDDAPASSCTSSDVMDDALEDWELRAAVEPPLPGFDRPPQRHGAPLGWLQPQSPSPAARSPGGASASRSPGAQRRSPLRWEALQLSGARDAEQEGDEDAEEEELSVASTPSVASRQRAVAAWVETTSPLMQPRLRHSIDGSGGGGAGRDWGEEEEGEDAWGRRGDSQQQQQRRSRSAAASPSTSGRLWPPPQRGSGSDAYGAPPPQLRPSPSRSERPHERGAVAPPLRRDAGSAGGSGEATTAAALGRLMHDMADVKRALLTQAAAEPAAWHAAQQQQQQQPFVRASPDRPAVLPPDAWLGSPSPSPHGGTPRRRVSSSSSAGRAATPRTSSGSRRAALWQQLESAADDDTPSPEEGHLSGVAWRAGGGALHDADDAFSFHADRSRPPSPELWRPPGASSPAHASAGGGARAASASASRAPPRAAARVERASSEWSDAEHSAPSEMESEMDSFRVGARRALAPPRHASATASAASPSPPEQTLAPEWWRETIPEEEAFDGAQPGTVLWEQRRAALAERCVSPPSRLRVCIPSFFPSFAIFSLHPRCCARRRVVALEQVLEDAAAAAEEAGWEREALVVRTTEAEAAATAAKADAAAASSRAAAELQSADYMRRLLTRAEQVSARTCPELHGLLSACCYCQLLIYA